MGNNCLEEINGFPLCQKQPECRVTTLTKFMELREESMSLQEAKLFSLTLKLKREQNIFHGITFISPDSELNFCNC